MTTYFFILEKTQSVESENAFKDIDITGSSYGTKACNITHLLRFFQLKSHLIVNVSI